MLACYQVRCYDLQLTFLTSCQPALKAYLLYFGGTSLQTGPSLKCPNTLQVWVFVLELLRINGDDKWGVATHCAWPISTIVHTCR